MLERHLVTVEFLFDHKVVEEGVALLRVVIEGVANPHADHLIRMAVSEQLHTGRADHGQVPAGVGAVVDVLHVLNNRPVVLLAPGQGRRLDSHGPLQRHEPCHQKRSYEGQGRRTIPEIAERKLVSER